MHVFGGMMVVARPTPNLLGSSPARSQVKAEGAQLSGRCPVRLPRPAAGSCARGCGGPVTARTVLKRLVRARMARTGESYTAALRVLRGRTKESFRMAISLRRINKPEFGYAISVPD